MGYSSESFFLKVFNGMAGWGLGGFGEGGTNILEYELNSLGLWPRVLWSSILEYNFLYLLCRKVIFCEYALYLLYKLFIKVIIFA